MHLARPGPEVEAQKAASAIVNSSAVAGLASQSGSFPKSFDISEVANSRRLGLDLAAALLSAAQALHGEVQKDGARSCDEPLTSGCETALRMLQLSIEEQQRQQYAALVNITTHWEERMAHMEKTISGGLESAAAATAQMQERSQHFTRVADVLEDVVREAVRTAIQVAGIVQEVRQADEAGPPHEQSEHLQRACGVPLQVATMCDQISRELNTALVRNPQDANNALVRNPQDADPLMQKDCVGSECDAAAGQSPVGSGTASDIAEAANVKETGSNNNSSSSSSSSSSRALQQPDEVLRRLELLGKELHGGILGSVSKHSPPASLILPEEPRRLGGSFALNGNSSNGTANGVCKTRVFQPRVPQMSQQQLGASTSPEIGSDSNVVLEEFGSKKSRPLADAMSDSTSLAGEGLVQTMARLVGLDSPSS